MTRGRTNSIVLMILAGGLLLVPTLPAQAGDSEIVPAPLGTAYGNGRCAHDGHKDHYGRNDCYDPCGSGTHAHGSSWRSIRYHLTGKERIRRRYLQHYFLRRYPFHRGHTRRFSQLTPERAAGINRHGVTRVDDVRRATDLERAGLNRRGVVFVNAIGKVAEDAPTPDAIDYLNRGMARFHWGMYKEAALDFDAALAGEDLAPARYGRMLCLVIGGKWDRVAAELGRMAKSGELRAEDRLLVNETFRKRGAYPSILEGLEGYVRFKGGTSASLVAAWAYLASGRVEEAVPYLRRVRRLMPEHAALPILEKAAGVSALPNVEAPKATPASAPVRPTAPALRPVSPRIAPLAEAKAG